MIVTAVPSVFLTYNLFSDNTLRRNIKLFIKEELDFIGTQAISHELDTENQILKVAIVGNELTANEIAHVEDKMRKYNIEDYHLKIIQGVQSDSLMRTKTKSETAKYAEQFNEQAITIKNLRDRLQQYTQYQDITKEIDTEIKILFTNVKNTTVINNSQEQSDQTEVLAVVEIAPETKMNKTDMLKLREWLTQRIKADSLRIIITNNICN